MDSKSKFEFVYVNQDGTARELSPEERAYLCEFFDPFDGGRPYIKASYNCVDGYGSPSGFIELKNVPSNITIQAVNPQYDFLLKSSEKSYREKLIEDHNAAGDIITVDTDKSFCAIPNPPSDR